MLDLEPADLILEEQGHGPIVAVGANAGFCALHQRLSVNLGIVVVPDQVVVVAVCVGKEVLGQVQTEGNGAENVKAGSVAGPKELHAEVFETRQHLFRRPHVWFPDGRHADVCAKVEHVSHVLDLTQLAHFVCIDAL